MQRRLVFPLLDLSKHKSNKNTLRLAEHLSEITRTAEFIPTDSLEMSIEKLLQETYSLRQAESPFGGAGHISLNLVHISLNLHFQVFCTAECLYCLLKTFESKF